MSASLSLLTQQLGLQLRYNLDSTQLPFPFVELQPDAATLSYIERASRRKHGRFLTALHRFLRGFLSDFDINGLLGTYPMHVLSTEQWGQLLSSTKRGSLLDVGAGRGDVTSCLAPWFEQVTVSETSQAMARRLRRLGYSVIEGDLALPEVHQALPASSFDAISLLNVLDRCARPLSLLNTARSLLRPGGLLLIALVIPYKPFFYQSGKTFPPYERLFIESEKMEEALLEFTQTLLSLGFHIELSARAPYLSGGDAQKPLYELDDLIVLCRAGAEIPILKV